MSWFFKSWRPAEKKDQARELRIATSESYSIRTSVEPLSVDGAGSYTSASKLRAALFVPEQSMTKRSSFGFICGAPGSGGFSARRR